jgi:hypothetical protein
VRILGLDTDEINGPHHKRALEQQAVLDGFLRRWIKPRIVADMGKTHDGWKVIKHHNGRFLCRVMVWSWRRLWWIDYSEYMINSKQVKRGSKWNGR